MKYIEYYKHMRKDAIIYAHLLNNFSYATRIISAGEKVILDRKHILIVKSGALFEENNGKKSGIARYFFPKSFFFPTRGSVVVKALETSEICCINADLVFRKLEEEGILSDFFLQVAEKNEQDLERQIFLVTERPKNKIVSTLNFILENNLSNSDIAAFPKWLQMGVLAQLANCSPHTISSTIHELRDRGLLDIQSTPWKILRKERKFEYLE
ncbi:Crp/Fnr family transcriptional regulator [Listeria monocytogenes]|nr:Crp/Fnr family transcriptional regulator [Listeria monocytogenes]